MAEYFVSVPILSHYILCHHLEHSIIQLIQSYCLKQTQITTKIRAGAKWKHVLHPSVGDLKCRKFNKVCKFLLGPERITDRVTFMLYVKLS